MEKYQLEAFEHKKKLLEKKCGINVNLIGYCNNLHLKYFRDGYKLLEDEGALKPVEDGEDRLKRMRGKKVIAKNQYPSCSICNQNLMKKREVENVSKAFLNKTTKINQHLESRVMVDNNSNNQVVIKIFTDLYMKGNLTE